MPRQSRGLYGLGRSKRLLGVADATPGDGATCRWLSAPEIQLLQPLILLLPILDVGSDHGFVPTRRQDEITPGSEVLPDEIVLPLAIEPCEMDGALALDVADHLGHDIFRGHNDRHVDVIDPKVPFLDPALLQLCQISENFAQMLMKLPVERLPPILRDKHRVVFARPLHVAYFLDLVHC